METLSGLWLPIVLSAVLLFVASSLIWNVLAAHKWHIKALPDEAGALEALGKQGLTPGQYAFPYTADPKAMKEPAFVEKLTKGPVGLLIVRPSGPIVMGKFLSLWFVYLLFVSAFVAFVTGQALPFGAEYMRVFRVAGSVAVAAYSLGQIPNAIWWGRPWKSAWKEVIDGIVYGLLTAGTFGWLWPR
jgi:hypothetical protein